MKVKRTENGMSEYLEIEGTDVEDVAKKASGGRELERVGSSRIGTVFVEYFPFEVMDDDFVEAILKESRIGTLLRIEVFEN